MKEYNSRYAYENALATDALAMNSVSSSAPGLVLGVVGLGLVGASAYFLFRKPQQAVVAAAAPNVVKPVVKPKPAVVKAPAPKAQAPSAPAPAPITTMPLTSTPQGPGGFAIQTAGTLESAAQSAAAAMGQWLAQAAPAEETDRGGSQFAHAAQTADSSFDALPEPSATDISPFVGG